MAKAVSQEVLNTAEAVFREHLKDRGLKYTPPRQDILQAVMSIDEHFEAEQLLLELRQRGKRVAKATIYRTLPILVSCNILKAVRFEDKQTHYEHTFGEDPHDHMVCVRCGRIIEFDSRDVVRMRTLMADRFKFHDTGHRFQITGLCESCVESCPAARRPFVMSTSSGRGSANKGRRKRAR